MQGDKLFPVYKNKNEDEWLIITGVGQLNVTSGVSYLYSLCPYARTSFWINFGIAGAGKKVGNIGDIFFINELRNFDHDKVYYPFILPQLSEFVMSALFHRFVFSMLANKAYLGSLL